MNIGIKATHLVEGGGQKHLEKLLYNYPRTSGTHLTVFLSEGQQHFDFPARDDITYRYFETPGKGLMHRVIWEQTTLRRHIKSANIDVLFEPGNLGMFSRKIPRVMLIHNLAPFSRELISTEPLLNKLRLYLLRLATGYSTRTARGVIHLTNYAQSYVNDVLGASRVPQRVVYMGNDREDTASMSRSDIDREYGIKGKLIFSCSHIYRYKNLKELVQAFKLLKDRNNEELTLVIAGKPYDTRYTAELQKFIADNHLRDSVLLLGSVNSGILTSFYAACDLFVFPSRLESASLILLEAMKMSAPIAASDTELCREVLDDAAVFFDPEDPESICRSMSGLLEDDVLRNALRKLALRRSRFFNWKQTARRTDEFIRDIMSIKTPAQIESKMPRDPETEEVKLDVTQVESVCSK